MINLFSDAFVGGIVYHMIVTFAQIMAVSKMNGCVVFISNRLRSFDNEIRIAELKMCFHSFIT